MPQKAFECRGFGGVLAKKLQMYFGKGIEGVIIVVALKE